MKKYKIWINMFDMGIYEGADEKDALDQYARDAGFESWAAFEAAQDVNDLEDVAPAQEAALKETFGEL